MGDAQGFLKHTSRELPKRRPVDLRRVLLERAQRDEGLAVAGD